MLNKYLRRLEKIIRDYQQFSLSQFKGSGNAKANFDDLVWFYTDPNTGRVTRFLCGLHGRRGKGHAGNRSEDALEYPYNYLIKIWIIMVCNEAISSNERKARVSSARKLLSSISSPLYLQTELTIDSQKLGARSHGRLRPFLSFCYDMGLMPKINLSADDLRDRTGHAQLENAIEKLPTTEALVVLGRIFSKVFENVDENGEVAHGARVNMRDALVVTFVLLCLASPNRCIAELPVLPKQKLKFHSEGDGAKVCYLDWIGSKGFKNNKNHVLACLSDQVTRSLNFFFKKCEPARVLCRFYENPKQTLGKLLSGHEIPEGIRRNLVMTKVPSLFTLGYALGFYDMDECVPVLKQGAELNGINPQLRGKYFENKPIHALTYDDVLSTSNTRSTRFSALPTLFGYYELPDIITDELIISVKDVQDWWIGYYKKSILPEFPLSFSRGEQSIRIKDSMFCFLGNWIYRDSKGIGSGGRSFQKSSYAVVPLSSVGASVMNRLTDSIVDSIFEAHGYSEDLILKPHSLRHFSNTLADISSIPVEIITAWSGRNSSEHTHTYIHTSDIDKGSRVRAIMNPTVVEEKHVRVLAMEDVSKILNVPANITSSGICTQQLLATPCDYLNDFTVQCHMCPQSCYVAADLEAIKLLEQDNQFQCARLEKLSLDPRVSSSVAMQSWYIIHSRNNHILSLLVSLMRSYESGTIIRYSPARSEFSLTNPKTKRVIKVSCALPNFENQLKELICSNSSAVEPTSNPELESLLSSFGLSEGSS